MFIKIDSSTTSTSRAKVQMATTLSEIAINETVDKLTEAATKLQQIPENEGVIAITEFGYFGVTKQKSGAGTSFIPSIALLKEDEPNAAKNTLPDIEFLEFLQERKLEIFIPINFITHPELKQGLGFLTPTLNRIAKTADIHAKLGFTGLSIYRDPTLRSRITIESATFMPEAA